MGAVRSRATFFGLWATQTSALVALETLRHHGAKLFWLGVIWGAVNALGLFAAHGGAHGQKFRPKLARMALLTLGVLYMLAALTALSVVSWTWIAVWGMAITQIVRNTHLKTEQDFQLACTVPVVLAIFSVGYFTAHWGVTRWIVLHLAALQFTLIAHHAEQRFDAHTARRHTQWLAPLSFAAMLAVLAITSLVLLWITQPPGLHAQLVPAQASRSPGAAGTPAGPGGDIGPSWLDAVHALFGKTLADAIRTVLAGLSTSTGIGDGGTGQPPFPWLSIFLFVAALVTALRWLRVVGWLRSGLELLWLDLRLHHLPPRTAMLATWDALERVLARLGAPRAASATHHEYARALRNRAWLDDLPLEDAARVVARARYGNTVVTPGEVAMGLWLVRGVHAQWWAARWASLPHEAIRRRRTAAQMGTP